MRSALCTVAVLLALVGCERRPGDQPARFELGKPAPPLSVEKIVQPTEGATATWNALRGKVVVLEFWATWCGPCVAAIAHLNELADSFKDRPVQFIAVTDEKEATVQQFLARKPMRAWVALDTDRSMFQAYGVEGIPRTIVVDARGVAVGDTYPTLLSAAALENVLAGRPPGLPVPPHEVETVAARRSADEEGAPPVVQVIIRESAAEGYLWSQDSTGFEFHGCELRTIIGSAYDVEPYQIVLPDELAGARFDAKVKVAAGHEAARLLLQSALTSALDLAVHRESHHRDGYRLVLPADGTHKLVATAMEPDAATHAGSGTDAAGMMNYTLSNETVATLCVTLGRLLGCPVRNDVGVEGRFDILLVWKLGDREGLLQAVREQLGLELQPAQQTVEVLIFEPAAGAPPAAPAPAAEGVSVAPPKFKTPAQVMAEAIEAQALVAIVRRASMGEMGAALRGFGDGQGGVSSAGAYFICNKCLNVLTVDEWITGAAVLPNTVYLLDACGGAAFVGRTRSGALPQGVDPRYTSVMYPTFLDPDSRWLVFCRPAAASDFAEKAAEYFTELLKSRTFRLDPPNVFVLADHRAGFVITDDPQAVKPSVWHVPGTFVNDLKNLLSSSGEEPQTELAREVLTLRDAAPQSRSPTNPSSTP